MASGASPAINCPHNFTKRDLEPSTSHKNNITNLQLIRTCRYLPTIHQTSRYTVQPPSRNGPNQSPCPTPPRERRHHLEPPLIESRRCEPVHQPWSRLTMHGETEGLNPLQPAIGEPPPSAPATEIRISCLTLEKDLSPDVSEPVLSPATILPSPLPTVHHQFDKLTRSKVQSRHPSRIA